MRLISLTLENIKSYIRETLNFYEGVNFISGANGAGKSTIIEALGIALFDTSPFSNLRQFVREGEKLGTITAVIEAADERLYRIVRQVRLPSGGTWTVYDEESGGELHQLHGNQDVKAWLAENLGLTRGLDPGLLFEDVVGISQGKFTAPFLERGERRKKIFNTILQLEGYREAFEKTAGLAGAIEKKILIKRSDRQRLLDRAQGLEKCREDLASLRERLEDIERKLQENHLNLQVVEQETGVQEETRNSLEKGEKERQSLEIRLEGLTAQKQRFLKDIEAALLCKEKIDGAFFGYREYLRLQDEQTILTEQKKQKEGLENEKQRLLNMLAVLKAEIASSAENHRRRLEQVSRELQETKAEGEKTARESKDATLRQNQAGEKLEKLLAEKVKWQELEVQLNFYRQEKMNYDHLAVNALELKSEINGLEESLQEWSKVALEAGKINDLEDELRLCRETWSQITVKISACAENRAVTQGGKCPFLQAPCQNVGGSLEDYFNREMEGLLPRKAKLEAEKNVLEQKLQMSKLAQQRLLVLEHQRDQAGKLKTRFDEVNEMMEKVRGKIREILYPAHLNLPQLTQISEKLKGFYKRDELSNLGEVLEIELASWNETVKKAEAECREAFQDAQKHYAAVGTRLEFLRDRYKKLAAESQELKEDGSLKVKETELRDKEAELSSLEKIFLTYHGLDERITENKKALQSLEPAYLIVMQNKEGAERLTTLQPELEKLETDIKERGADLNGITDRIALLRDSYNPERLTELKKYRDDLLAERGQKNGEREYINQEIERITHLVADKEKAQMEALELNKEIHKMEKSGEFLRMARSVLNQSGERMAQEYRRVLGHEADSIYREIAAEHVQLQWGDDYEVKILDNLDGKERERAFQQLSGGEKMSAALAVRLALLKQLSQLGIGFFDEPTANLDDQRRTNLAAIIPRITQDFRQIFVISHDDTFDAITDNVIVLKKETGKGTKIVHE